jgi:hypothetical protein
VRDDDGEIAQQRVVDPRRRTRSKPKQRGRGKQTGKESKDEKEPQFGSPPDQIVIEQRAPGVFCDDTNRDAFEIPKGAQWKTGDKVPDSPLQQRSRMVEDRIVGGYRALLSTASPEV